MPHEHAGNEVPGAAGSSLRSMWPSESPPREPTPTPEEIAAARAKEGFNRSAMSAGMRSMAYGLCAACLGSLAIGRIASDALGIKSAEDLRGLVGRTAEPLGLRARKALGPLRERVREAGPQLGEGRAKEKQSDEFARRLRMRFS